MPPATITFEPTPDRSRDLRRAFGCFGTGVTIVTTLTDKGPLGMTANSFSSLSLDPALVLWSPAKSSQRHGAFVAADAFSIHVLSAAQFSLAERFATDGYNFSGVDWVDGPLGAPEIQACLAVFHCKRYAVHPAGDHSLVLGQVMHVRQGTAAQASLIFERGKFGRFRLSAYSDQ